jgi:hypothetical protein
VVREPGDRGEGAAALGPSILLGFVVIALAWLKFALGGNGWLTDAVFLAGGFGR